MFCLKTAAFAGALNVVAERLPHASGSVELNEDCRDISEINTGKLWSTVFVSMERWSSAAIIARSLRFCSGTAFFTAELDYAWRHVDCARVSSEGERR